MRRVSSELQKAADNFPMFIKMSVKMAKIFMLSEGKICPEFHVKTSPNQTILQGSCNSMQITDLTKALLHVRWKRMLRIDHNLPLHFKGLNNEIYMILLIRLTIHKDCFTIWFEKHSKLQHLPFFY